VRAVFLAALLLTGAVPAPVAVAEAAASMKRQQIIDQLTPAPRTRGLVLVEEEVQASVSFDNIRFELNSSTLTGNALDQVREIAAALQDQRLSSYRFEIAGHTDGRGSAAHNLALSAARAEAVLKALVVLGVAEHRLRSRGWGQSRYLPGVDPGDGRQRRVEIVNLGQ
jgi:outer membrane protein OmpA-like peptidoglycan-associated protein